MQNTFQKPQPQRLFLKILMILGWFALLAQLYINVTSRMAELPELLVRYFSYFTILTNLIVAICCTSLLIPSKFTEFFSSPKRQTAIAVYILVVGLVYNIILRFLWSPAGLQRLADELLHSVVPVLYVAYWFVFVPKKQLEWRNLLPWLIYPLAYVVFIIIRGLFSGFYPYPFMDIDTLGAHAVLMNSIGITALFVGFSLLFIVIGKYSKTN